MDYNTLNASSSDTQLDTNLYRFNSNCLPTASKAVSDRGSDSPLYIRVTPKDQLQPDEYTTDNNTEVIVFLALYQANDK